ncbi:nitroreductase [Streptomyces sp. ML-6]|uniref:Acg family FMN-binding oxidoreductase n=1 Tax=Streptomyces sp. ML-6 TaxID=2982693 RepID=UPI0024C0439B|nr:nitroreductase [Streptomyces sp. ML-6]MDK0520178.1 nitroreductase [Streptomyces sp. ML-6]
MSSQSLDDATLTELVADAAAAPSMHNAQPWRFRATRAGRTVTLLADLDRALPEEDPATRALHVGCGAALLNLRVSAAHRGLHAVTTLLPDPSAPAMLATVRLDHRTDGNTGETGHGDADGGGGGDADGGGDAALAALYPAIRERHTSRYPFDEQRIPPEIRELLVGAARAEGAEFAFLASPHLEAVLDLIRDAEGYAREDPAREAEQRSWTRDTRTEAPVDGITDYAMGPRDASARATARDFLGTAPQPGRPRVPFEKRPQLALLSTAGDHAVDWLRAGQALERMLLTATLHGVSTAFATQPLEWPDLRWLLRDPVHGSGHAQMIVRLGYGPTGPRTPRRPMDQVLTIEP